MLSLAYRVTSSLFAAIPALSMTTLMPVIQANSTAGIAMITPPDGRRAFVLREGDPVASDEPWRARDSWHELVQLGLGAG
jgi:hypothetical protein